jgi:hypothetical protein
MPETNPGLFLGQAFQQGYVTTDMDRAVATFKDRYGAGAYKRTGKVSFPLDDGRRMTVDLAMGWIRDTMIEIIQPIADDVSVYADWLPKQGFALKFHHIGVRLYTAAEWDKMMAEANARGHKEAFCITTPNSRSLYLDTSADLGHYIEYIYYADVTKSNLGQLPQNVAGHTARF